MDGKKTTCSAAVALALLALLSFPQMSFGWFAVPPPSGVDTVYGTGDTYVSSYASPGNQVEWQQNYGGNGMLRIKGSECPALFQFNLTSYKGKQIVGAELHLARSNADVVSALAVSTVNTDWAENFVSYRYKSSGTEWTYPHSDITTATFGNFGTLTCFGFSASDTFRSYSYNGYTWIAITLDPDLVYAMILDNPGGLAVTDARFYGVGNPTVYSRDQYPQTGQPRLYIQAVAGADTTPPSAVGSLAAAAGQDNGSVVLSFLAPTDPTDAGNKAFGYTVRYSAGGNFNSATDVQRWRIARPKAPGEQNRVLIEGLTPGATLTFFVQAYDRMGNVSPVSSVVFTVPANVATPTLANGGLATPNPAGKTVRTDPSGTRMRYFAATEACKISPTTGNIVAGASGDDYKKANAIWDAGTNTISLRGCRNEMVGAQLVLQRMGANLNGVHVTVSDLTGPGGAVIPANPNIELFQLHTVSGYPDAAIPLASPFATVFNIPDASRNNNGTYQSVWMDFYLPKDATPGDYTGTVTITATGMTNTTANLQVRVSSLMIPDYPTFLVDLNGYGNPWDFGSNHAATCLNYFQLCHKHRAVCNTLPYGWSGNVQADRCCVLTGSGPTRHALSWATFDNKYGRFFDGSAFTSAQGYTGPGANTPITHFYTTFNEGWPVAIMDSVYGFDAAGQGPAYWDNLKNTGQYSVLFPNLPDLYLAFPSGYKTGHQNVLTDWVNHAHALGWTKTAFEIYFNEKYSYNGAHVFWTMEENSQADDFYADGYYHGMYRAAYDDSGVTDVPWHFRIDISDRYGQNWGQLDNRINWWNLGSGAAGWHFPQKYYRQFHIDSNRQEDWIWYGLGSSPGSNGLANARVFLQKWSQGFNGGLPWWDCYQTNWTSANELSVVYAGGGSYSVPGHGPYNGAIMSIRVKEARQVQQIIELLNMWADSGAANINRNRVRDSLNAKYGAGTWDYSFNSLSETGLHQLRADLVAQLESLLPAAPTTPGPAHGATILSNTPSLTWDEATPNTTFDVYLDTVNPPVAKVASGLTAMTFTTEALQPGTTYYWKVVAISNIGSTPGPVWSFSVMGPPAAPSNPNPADPSWNLSLATSFSWSGAAAGVTFDVYMDDQNPPVTKVASDLVVGAHTPISLAASEYNYYWRVVAKNVAGETAGPVWVFQTHFPGDVDGDSNLDSTDLLALANCWATSRGDPSFDPECDFNGDGVINILDLLILAMYWGG